MAISAGNADVLVPIFQPGEQQHRRRIATWALHVNQDLAGFHSSVSDMAALVQNISSGATVVAMSVGTETPHVFNSGSITAITTWLTPFVDTHSAMNTTTGVYTIPQNGVYSIHGKVLFNTTAMAAGTEVYCEIHKNGTRAAVGWKAIDAAVTMYQMPMVTALLSCSAADTITFHAASPTNGSTLYSGANDGRFYNQLQIHKVK